MVQPSDQIEALWRYYDEQAAQARQHENLRATVTGALAGIAAAVVGFAGVGGLDPTDIPSGVVVLVLSGGGTALSYKHYERNRFHTAIMGVTRAQIDDLVFAGSASKTTSQLRAEGESRNQREYPTWSKIRLHVLWLGLPIVIGVLGALVILGAVVGVQSAPQVGSPAASQVGPS